MRHLNLIVLLIAGCGQANPIHEGRPVTRWIERLDSKNPADVQSAIEALISCGSPAIPRVTAAMAGSDLQIRVGAARVLLQCGPDAQQHVLQAFQQAGDPLMQLSLAQAILADGRECPEAIHAVMAGLLNADAEVRHRAIHALGDITPHAAAATLTLTGYLRASAADQRYHSALALLRIGPAATEATPTLIEALHDSDARVRQAAVQALGAIGEQARPATAALLALRGDPSDEVRWQAGQVLKAWQAQ